MCVRKADGGVNRSSETAAPPAVALAVGTDRGGAAGCVGGAGRAAGAGIDGPEGADGADVESGTAEDGSGELHRGCAVQDATAAARCGIDGAGTWEGVGGGGAGKRDQAD